jgi:hypothetical protein
MSTFSWPGTTGRRGRARKQAVAGLAALAAMIAPAAWTAATSRAAAATTTAVQHLAAPDFATVAWADPWDFRNTADLLIDNGGPTESVNSASISGGSLNFYISKSGYISPLWNGYPGALQMDRDGALPANSINATAYTWLSFDAYASSNLNAGIDWFTCAGPHKTCEGGMPINLHKGWHVYAFHLVNDPRYNLPKAWSGAIHGLRLALNPPSGTDVHMTFAWMRLYEPGKSVTAPPESVTYSTSSTAPTSESRNGGPLPGCTSTGSSCNRDLSAFPPGTYYLFNSAHSLTGEAILYPIPRPVFDTPSVDSGPAVSASDPWGPFAPSDIYHLVHICNANYNGGLLNGSTCHNKYSADPEIWFAMHNKTFNGGTYYNVTVNVSYNQAFNLDDCHGTMGRVFWHLSGDTQTAQTAPWVTYHDVHVYSYRMNVPEKYLGDASQPWTELPFASTHNITSIAWKPSEAGTGSTWSSAACQENFHLAWFRVTGADRPTSTGMYTIHWHDYGAMNGETISFYYTKTGPSVTSAGSFTGTEIGSTTDSSGEHTFTWHTKGVLAGTYTLFAKVVTSAGVFQRFSTGQVYVP